MVLDSFYLTYFAYHDILVIHHISSLSTLRIGLDEISRDCAPGSSPAASLDWQRLGTHVPICRVWRSHHVPGEPRPAQGQAVLELLWPHREWVWDRKATSRGLRRNPAQPPTAPLHEGSQLSRPSHLPGPSGVLPGDSQLP